MTRTLQVSFDTHDPELLSRFWAAATGYVNPAPPGREVEPGHDVFEAWRAFLAEVGVPESQWNSASAAEDPEGVGPRLFFQQVPEGKTAKNRMHIDVGVEGQGDERVRNVRSHTEHLVSLGATVLQEMEENGEFWIVLQDPEGNEFCVQ